MRICAVSLNFCIRATQTCLAARAAGHEVHAVVALEACGRQFNGQLDSIATFSTESQMLKAIENTRPDIIHVHDRPHQIPGTVLSREWPCPVVHDVHDMFSCMVPGQTAAEDSPFERDSLLKADGLVFVSEPNLQYAAKRYGQLPPSMVVKSAVSTKFFPPIRFPRIGSAVWGGGLYREDKGTPRNYIDQREIVSRFASVGQSATVYCAPADAGVMEAYAACGAIMAGVQPYVTMLQAYSRYDFGWYGQTEDHQQIHDTLPNKLFEYVAAGLPVLVINAREAGRFVEEQGLGVHIRRPEDVVYVRDRLEALRPTLWEHRYAFTRENECRALWPWYEQLIRAKAGKGKA
jgi:glycosyltransferase involved in cell wall biosynthesis